LGDTYPAIKVAAVQAAPVFLDKKVTTDKTCNLIREAGRKGAKIVVFPEGFIPSHPVWYHFYAGTDKRAIKLSIELFKNSIEIPGAEIDALCNAAKDAGCYVIVGICEKMSDTTGTMFNTQVYIGPDGKYLGKHQKIMPTVGERFVHKGGYGDTLGVFNTDYGPVSALMCSENSNPLAIFALIAQGTRIHAMSWPNYWGKASPPMRKCVSIASLNFAWAAKAYVISSCSTIDDNMIEMMNLNDDQVAFLRKPEITGGSMIVAPNAEILAGPMGNEEGIIYADINTENCVKGKVNIDFAGHYNRSDIFQLRICRDNPKIFTELRKIDMQVNNDLVTSHDLMAIDDDENPFSG
jgi:nitrilase